VRAVILPPRHLRAIRDTGNQLLAAVDPKDSVGVLDQYSFDVKFFTEIERFRPPSRKTAPRTRRGAHPLCFGLFAELFA
jgi:hypothetical protein